MISNARSWKQSPASTAVDSSKARWTVGLPRRKIVIVHARQIVMDQRIDVDRLDRRAGADAALLVEPEQPAGGDGQQRPDALAAAEPGVAHRLEQTVAPVARTDQIA